MLFVSRFILKPKYEAACTAYITVLLYDNEIKMGYREMRASFELAESYILYMKEDFIVKSAYKNLSSELSDKYTLEEFDNTINVSLVPGTCVLKYTAKTESREDSVELCNYYAKYSMDKVIDLINIGFYEDLTEASYEETERVNNILKNSVIGAIIGIVTSASVLYIISFLDRKIRTTEKYKKAFPNLRILGEVTLIGDIHD